MCSALLEPGITIYPACKCHLMIICAEVLLYLEANFLITSLLKFSEVCPLPPKGYHDSIIILFFLTYSCSSLF